MPNGPLSITRFSEYKLQRISSMLPAFTEEQIAYISELQNIAQEQRDRVPARPISAFLDSMNVYHPRFLTAAMRRSAQARSKPTSNRAI